jgi:DNA helicase II / ATP-dependent DNA helicase PcrA
MDSISEITKDLNPRQLEAVEKTEGYVRVIAGAGSGKTKALTSRYAYIVKALGISSANILCVTFTNKAAQEIRQRIRALVGHDADLGYITTYHGFCVKILREDINKLYYPKGFLILDTEDQKALLRTIYKELGLSSRDYTFKTVIEKIHRCKINDSYIDYLLNPKKPDCLDPFWEIFYRYLDLQLKNFALDYDDLILFAFRILTSHEDVLSKWQKRLHYIQVDEMQDSSKRQFDLICLLSGYHQNLFVVGDPDQTIYEWRGADPELLVEFDQRFENTQTVIMNQNYRSTPNILDLGNDLIKKNQIRVDKDLFTENSTGVDVVHFHGKTEFEESLWVASTIKTHILQFKKRPNLIV